MVEAITVEMQTFLLLCVLALPFVLIWVLIALLTVTIGNDTTRR